MDNTFEAWKRSAEYYADFSEWTTTPPTERGVYWVVWKGSRNIYVVEFDGSVVMVIGDERSERVEDVSHWRGPLPKPEPPD